MSIYREATIYVSKRTLKRLKWIRAAGLGPALKNDSTGNVERLQVTLDQLADLMLNAHIEQNYPGIVPAEKLFYKVEDQAIETLKNTH